MERVVLKLSLWVTVALIFQMNVYNCCLEKERNALLEIKAFFKSISTTDLDDVLPSWVDDKMSDCCGWERIECNPTTGRVTELSLNYARMLDEDVETHLPILNTSLFHTFNQELETLDLSENYLGGISNDYKGDANLGSLRKLKTLNLGDNHFNESIFSNLIGLDSLTILDLSGNVIESIPPRRLATFRNLEVLDLSINNLNSFLSIQGDANLGSLRKLKTLNLRGNHLNESIFSNLIGLDSLTTLGLSFNVIESIPPRRLATLRNLEVLDLSYNYINNSLSIQGICELENLTTLNINIINIRSLECLSNLTNLQHLRLHLNQARGNITFDFSKFTSLEELDLVVRKVEGLFILSSLANLTKLESLSISSDDNMFQVVDENIPWIPAFQLKTLVLSNCISSGKIPWFLPSQHDLEIVYLSDNTLVGTFPAWLWQNNTKLQQFSLRNNSFTGPLPSLDSRFGLLMLDLSRNNLSGQIPMNIGMILPNLDYMNMSKNSFEGNVPSSMGEMKNLTMLALSSNKLSGKLPIQFMAGCNSLRYLDLSNNNLHGHILPTYANFTHLSFLLLNDNNFSGNIGSGFLNSKSLVTLDISSNRLDGPLPWWMVNLTNLWGLDVSKNRLFGSVSSSLDFSSIRYLYMQKNAFNGPIPKALFNSTRLSILDMSDNEFSESIPDMINKDSRIKILVLRENRLRGHIPNQLCHLKETRIMDLSHNELEGPIPSCFGDLPFRSTNASDSDSYDMQIFGTYTSYPNSKPITIWELSVEFITKNRYDSYRASILVYMSGLDLSCNKLNGSIPQSLGFLAEIHALNLSHNCLSGSIPKSFSSLKNVESLDLSYNKLSGLIPPQLSELNFLGTFDVSYNNLSGPIPNVGQFASSDEKSYKGNPCLCGQALNKSCSSESTSKNRAGFGALPATDDEYAAIDMVTFSWSFGASYITVIVGIFLILWLNSHWRNMWFDFIDACVYFCFSWLFKCLYYRRLYRWS